MLKIKNLFLRIWYAVLYRIKPCPKDHFRIKNNVGSGMTVGWPNINDPTSPVYDYIKVGPYGFVDVPYLDPWDNNSFKREEYDTDLN